METNFFQSLAALSQTGSEWVIVIKQTAPDQMIISVLYKNDDCGDPARKIIPPLTFNQSPQLLDEHFFDDLNAAVPETAQLLNSMEHYLKQREAAKTKSAMQNSEKPKTEKLNNDSDNGQPVKSKKEQQYEAAMQKADDLEKAGKPRDAWMIVPEPTDYPEYADTIRARRRELSAQFEQTSLFNS